MLLAHQTSTSGSRKSPGPNPAATTAQTPTGPIGAPEVPACGQPDEHPKVEPPTPLRLRDVRALFRLINDIRELAADPQKWRPHMVRRLRGLMGASIVVSSEIHFRKIPRGAGDPGEPTSGPAVEAGAPKGNGPMRVTDIGWVSDPEGHVSRIHTVRDDASPDMFWLTPSPDTGQGSPAGGDLVPVKPSRKVYGGTAFILSQIALPHAGAVDQLGLHREWGDRPFTSTEHRLVRMFHVELARLWKRDVLRRAGDPGSDLPPRLAQTLDELLNGASEKQIATRLQLSRHTIHNYVKTLHKRFGVSSRGELLAKAGVARSESAPRLSLALPRAGKRK